MRNESFIDRAFRKYGEEFFGRTAMDMITTAQVEEARCAAMTELADLTRKYGLQDESTVKELFCNYILENFI